MVATKKFGILQLDLSMPVSAKPLEKAYLTTYKYLASSTN